MTAIMKITITTAVILGLAGCSTGVVTNNGRSFYPPISADGMQRVLEHPSHPGVILNGSSATANRHYR